MAGPNTEAAPSEQARMPKPAPAVKIAKVVPEPVAPETSQEPATEPVIPAYIERNPVGGPESVEKQRYRQAREKAAGDRHVAELRKAMETTGDGEAYKTAARSYVKALFSKIRKLEPDLTDSLNKKEDAYRRRIDAGKALAD